MDQALDGRPASSGVEVSSDTAMNFSAVWNAVNIISGAIASLPLQVYERVGDSGKRPARNNPLYPILHDQPNPEMTSYVFREILQGHLLMFGNAFAEIIKD